MGLACSSGWYRSQTLIELKARGHVALRPIASVSQFSAVLSVLNYHGDLIINGKKELK